MKRWHIDAQGALRRAAVALLCMAGTATGLPAVAADGLCATATADSVIVIRTDSADTTELPDSIVRRLAAKPGIPDSTEARQRYATNPCKSDTAAYIGTRYERNREKRIRGWAKLIPEQGTLQYAGSIGLMSIGIGWHYGRGDHWETELLVGFLPRYHSEGAKSTFTLKQRYVPWHCVLGTRWTVEPLTAGVFFNTISGDDFWKNQPDRYPKNYYGFSTKVRANIFLGQRLRYNIPSKRRIYIRALSLYYELSSCDLYIVSKATNKHFPWRETLSLAFGLRWEM